MLEKTKIRSSSEVQIPKFHRQHCRPKKMKKIRCFLCDHSLCSEFYLQIKRMTSVELDLATFLWTFANLLTAPGILCSHNNRKELALEFSNTDDPNFTKLCTRNSDYRYEVLESHRSPTALTIQPKQTQEAGSMIRLVLHLTHTSKGRYILTNESICSDQWFFDYYPQKYLALECFDYWRPNPVKSHTNTSLSGSILDTIDGFILWNDILTPKHRSMWHTNSNKT